MRAFASGALAALTLMLGSCMSVPPKTPPVSVPAREPEPMPLSFLTDHDAKQALAAFLKSCEAPARMAAEYRPLCGKAKQAGDAKAFFATHFTVRQQQGERGLLTGYYVPELRASSARKVPYVTPIYGVPKDLRKSAAYLTREEIETKGLAGSAEPIAWVDDKIGAFFLHVQGSGRLRFADGSVKQVTYAADNGQAYTAIGKVLVEQNELKKEDVSLFTLREWLRAHPARADALMRRNARYIFFTLTDAKGVKGSSGAELTAGYSLAVDPAHIPYGAPVLAEGTLPATEFGPSQPLARVMIAQDTGAAIKGAQRGDVFFGAGRQAEALAGLMKSPASLSILVPRP